MNSRTRLQRLWNYNVIKIVPYKRAAGLETLIKLLRYCTATNKKFQVRNKSAAMSSCSITTIQCEFQQRLYAFILSGNVLSKPDYMSLTSAHSKCKHSRLESSHQGVSKCCENIGCCVLRLHTAAQFGPSAVKCNQ
jgi:hypothetical protein